MSGFAGIFNLDGAPVDRALIESMTRSLAFRGPDAQETWCEGAVGLGHAMLRVTRESAHERQPAALDGRLQIVANARIDARADLIRDLNAESTRGDEASLATPDSQLILRAFDTWGEACVDHLLGDFSFAIWDASRQLLFCGRDHFGVKSLYYARIGNALVFSNTLDTIRLYPGFSTDLCDAAIADFLLFGLNVQLTRTPYEQILRLPPAHALVASAHTIRTNRYWSFPVEEPLLYRSKRDYIDQFQELLCLAVKDRLRCDRVSISLSGGLDSPTVAAEVGRQLEVPDNILGITGGFSRLISDPEPRFARIVAESLKIPWHYIAIDDYKPFQRWELSELCRSSPADITIGAYRCDFMDQVSSHGRVLLTGEGGDPGLAPSLSYYRGFGVLRLATEVGRYMLTHGRHPRIGFRLTWQRWREKPRNNFSNYPRWLDPQLEARLELRGRSANIMLEPPFIHPYRPDSYENLYGPWFAFFENDESSGRKSHVETRHPLFDVRLQRFFLRLPVLPWCADKEILRLAMRGRLPDSILDRSKSTLHENPMSAILSEMPRSALRDFIESPQLHRYVIRDQIPDITAGAESADPEVDLRPINLNYWLDRQSDKVQ